MANVLAPFGFMHRGTASGPVNFAESHNPPYRIAGGSSPYTTALYFGDLVKMNASLTGYVEQWVAGDGGTAARIPIGIFVGCSYYSASQAKNIESRYWPGTTDAVGDVNAYVIDDPNAEFKVQSGGTSAAITQTSMGQTVDISATPVGNTTTGISGMTIGTPTTTATLPLKVVGLILDPAGTNGTDLTTPYNYVIVAFNNQMFKSLVESNHMAINVAAIRDLLLPGLRGVTGEYKQYPAIWPKLFDQGKSEMAQERTASMRFLPLAQLKTDGGQTAFDNASGEAFVYNQLHTGIGLGYAITRNTIADNLYKAQFRPSNLGLQRSFAQTKEIYAAAVFNNSVTYQTMLGGDGVSLINTAHPLPAGGSGPSIWANRPATDVDLNEASLLNGMISIQTGFYDNAGLRMMATGKTLVIHPNNEPVAERLLRTELRPGTGDNDLNVIPTVAGGLSDYVKDVFFTNAFAWYIKTDQPGLLYLEREPFEIDMQVDFTTDNLLVKGWERYSFNYNDPRSLWGTAPTS